MSVQVTLGSIHICAVTDARSTHHQPLHICLRHAQVTVQYNLCNEPWVKYSMAGVADRGLAPSLWSSARLHHHTLYLETHRWESVPSPLRLSERTNQSVDLCAAVA